MMDLRDIQKILPQRAPMIMIDKVVECAPGESLLAVKNVTVNEKFFKGHFPEKKIMPGVLISEAMVQAASVLLSASLPDEQRYDFYLKDIKVKFMHPAIPGDILKIDVVLSEKEDMIAMFKMAANVDEKKVASATCTLEAKGV